MVDGEMKGLPDRHGGGNEMDGQAAVDGVSTPNWLVVVRLILSHPTETSVPSSLRLAQDICKGHGTIFAVLFGQTSHAGTGSPKPHGRG